MSQDASHGESAKIKTEVPNGLTGEPLTIIDSSKRSNSEFEADSPSLERTTSMTTKKKKRRQLSCLSCRKLKTRCEFEDEHGKCHRCFKLRLDCSLTAEYNIDPEKIKVKKETTTAQNQGEKGVNDRLGAVENNIDMLGSKMDSIISLLRGANKKNRTSSSFSSYTENAIAEDGIIPFQRKLSLASRSGDLLESTTDEYLDKYVGDAPLNIIKAIDSRLFQRSNKYDPLKQACEEFLAFYFANESLCLQLAKSFLETSHFWIIPGGIKELNRTYVIEHPLITCVFVILAMCFDENYNYIEEQQQLYWLTTKLLGIALITDPLTDHDIEAILYLSLYNIARKPKQPQTDSWILSGTGIKHFIISMEFTAIKNRVLYLRQYGNDDLYHLRIWNALCACHFQASLLSGRPVLIPREYLDIHNLTLKFPRAAIGDAIKVSELDLDVKFSRILENSRDYLQILILRSEEANGGSGEFQLRFQEMDDWKKKWEHLIKKDISGILLFAYDTYHVFICRRFISLIQEGDLKAHNQEACLTKAYKTACHHSFVILERLLKLPASLIRGSPSSALAQIVYASLTLCDFLSVMNIDDKSMALNLISKIYWHLNHIGEKMNDATDTVGKIIKSIVETASTSDDNTAVPKPDPNSGTAPQQQPAHLTKNSNDKVYDPAKAATEDRRKSFSASLSSSGIGINPPSNGSVPSSVVPASNGKASSPANSSASGASAYSRPMNFYSGTIDKLHLNQVLSPDMNQKRSTLAAESPLNDLHPVVASRHSPFSFDSTAIPDVSQFNTFEEFFNGIFSEFNGDFSNVMSSRPTGSTTANKKKYKEQ